MKAYEILDNLEMTLGSASKSDVLAISRAADEGGTIQADAMVQLFPAQPELHTATNIRRALIAAGCTE